MKKAVVIFAGILLLLLGTISMVSPIPGGTFMLAFGSVLLICASPWFRRCLQFFRKRFHWFNKLMGWLERKTGQRIGGVLKLTQPGYELKPGDHGSKPNS